MLKTIGWNRWSIATKILVPFLALSVISIAILAYFAINHIDELGRHARETDRSLGQSAIEDSTAQLNRLGEEIIAQKAGDVASLAEMYLETSGLNTGEEIKNSSSLRELVIQPVGITGYTTLIDPIGKTILIHKFPEQEKDITPLRESLPSFWALIEASSSGETVSGYYDWQEVDGSIREKYASIVPVRTADGRLLTIWATTYIEEFSQPAIETEAEINAAIAQSDSYISTQVSNMRKIFIIVFFVLVLVVTVIALMLSRAITMPVKSLREGAGEIGRGRLDYKLELNSRDELGSLAESFNLMARELKKYIEELQKTSEDNINKERIIQENLRLYVQKINQAQEAERNRIARELHDETVQSLIVITRKLEETFGKSSRTSAAEIREDVREVIRGIRRFSQELRPSVLDDLGLVPAVQAMAKDLEKDYGIKVDTVIEGKKKQLPAESELLIFRIIQEALTNIRKHSRATKAGVNIDFSAGNIRVVIEDNGTGFDVPENLGDLTRTDKLGLVGIQERTQLLGGKIGIESRPGKGTAISIDIPL